VHNIKQLVIVHIIHNPEKTSNEKPKELQHHT